jgi:hypothetical protein
MWGSDADKLEFGAIFPLWYAQDHAVRDGKAAVVRLRVLAARGYAPGLFALTMAYFDGQNVRRDYSLCYRSCLASAEQGYPSAVGMIGNFYCTATPNYGVCEYNPAEGVQWWRRSAENGNAGSQFNLATAYSTGNGIEKNNLEGFVWASLAVHCSSIRHRMAEVLRDRLSAELDPAQRTDADARLLVLKATLPLPWSEHLRYWKFLARET